MSHAKNVANFDRIISYCTSYGADYHPINPAITLVGLNALSQKAKDALQLVKDTKAAYDIEVNNRQAEFKDLSKLGTRIINAVIALGLDDALVRDIRSILNKLQGKRSGKLPTESDAPDEPILDDTLEPTEETPDKPRNISVSQRSYDNQIDFFAELIALLSTEPAYAPFETELKLDQLQAKLTALTTIHQTVIDAYTTYSNALIERDTILYAPDTGLVDVVKDVRAYIKSIYGANSPKYKQFTDVSFRTIKR